MQGYTITTNPEDLDIEVVYDVISNSYWAAGIPKQTLEKAISNSLCFGVYDSAGSQVGFARVITDRATFAYLGDVFVTQEHQGLGIGKWLIETVVSHSELQGLRRMFLATRDAHGLYKQFGFEAVENPDILMQIWQPDVYR
ncbi:Histone acetyltransferase HPA2/related acetyltransferase [Vibrio nigripulchritudo SO65]|uniref:Histone acetyltransferase HPA2/related acetyltransferase n=1 Tax=Vibrio nigripulchritudo SOn1 TaxID=1238450 RepID=A0AAV2VR40_9VIBR|nr:GNAT family N-acetyltransferase [Vibrio nigripulchritudo]CCN34194.1 Histone acetyltransferase HPA2/related acetyltransferase [Vibrio nigripulchritudo AM115]CCN44009.1 Histone acetyltransferase HPA2/related acetyltransferase [Vibrio nigripulchritudo FTn2]CCN66911.1 Histone acetyltransferase HPA2/related acetyltransferase [Vibrio nigripulchritudo POn4]CCN76674.1 Histone acetyltransferase HPA2/related acetyltransferase [Vibrio nigripulchritudo SO65]CCO47205.1 Histone acetyltransferase HPA2/rel